MKLSQTLANATQTVMIYGPPNTGKTELVGGLSSDYDLIWFDLDNGADTLRKLPLSQQERIEHIALRDTRSYPIGIETCLKVIKGGPCDICEAHGKVACSLCKRDNSPTTHVQLSTLGSGGIAVFDSTTQLVNSAIAHITKGQPDDYKLNYDDWGNLGKLMDIFFSHIQQANFNVVCISHETEAEMEDGKMKIFPVGGTRNYSRNVARFFGHVVHCNIKGNKHTFSSSTTSILNTIAGSRLDVAIEKMEKASLLPIFKSSPTGAAIGPTPNKSVASQTTGPQTNGQVAASRLAGLVAARAAGTGEKK